MAKKRELIIRRAKEADIFSIIELLGELFEIENDFAFDFVKHQKGLHLLLKSEHDVIFVAEMDGKVVGVATMQRIISTAMGSFVGLVEDAIVKKEYNGLGIATRLFEQLFSYAKEQNYTRIHLLCDEDNPPAQKFYKKMGFKESEMNAWYYFL